MKPPPHHLRKLTQLFIPGMTPQPQGIVRSNPFPVLYLPPNFIGQRCDRAHVSSLSPQPEKLRFENRQRKAEHRPFAQLARHGQRAVVSFDDRSADR